MIHRFDKRIINSYIIYVFVITEIGILKRKVKNKYVNFHNTKIKILKPQKSAFKFRSLNEKISPIFLNDRIISFLSIHFLDDKSFL
jgi:hypothetical protein